MKNRPLLLSALLCLGMGACDDAAFSVVCPGEALPSLLVNVVDSVSGESVSHEASGWWTTGAVTDSLRHVRPSNVDGAVRLAAYGPPGTYEVRVVHPGHPDWVRGNIQVVQGTCGPAAQDLVAQLNGAH